MSQTPPPSPAVLARAIAQGRGLIPADLVLKGGAFLDLVTGDIRTGDVAISRDRIVGTGGSYEGLQVVDAGGSIIVPGFVDTHFHCESSLLTPLEYDRCVLRHGVTTAIWDPHEIANVLGREGIGFALRAAETCAMDIRVMLSSCVPASPLETSGAALDVHDLLAFANHPKALGLAEMMNFPGVIAGDEGCLAKLSAFHGRPLDGHAPLLGGRDLDGYLAAGIRTDHETTSEREAREKLSKGMTILIREGSVSKDLHALAGILNVSTSPFCCLCTDDRNPLDIAEEGHLDFMIRTLIAKGVPVLAAYRAASWSGANAYGLKDRGLVAPGWRADLVLLDDLETCRVSRVVAGGRLVEDRLFAERRPLPLAGRGSVKLPEITAETMKLPGESGPRPVIGVLPGKIITEHLTVPLKARGGFVAADPAQDALPFVVIERHGKNGNFGRGFVRGFGLQRGAIASSVGHDSHNVSVIGVDPADMALAALRIGEMEGGFVVASEGRILAELALPLAGLMSLLTFEEVRERLIDLRRAARAIGCVLPEPFLQVAFLSLSVIPHLKLTDRGLVDVDRFALI